MDNILEIFPGGASGFFGNKIYDIVAIPEGLLLVQITKKHSPVKPLIGRGKLQRKEMKVFLRRWHPLCPLVQLCWIDMVKSQ